MDENALVTYFRKGKLEKFYLASESQNAELDFLTTAKLFEASEKTPGQKIHKDFHGLLASNKTQIEIDLLEIEEEEDTTKKGGRDNATRIRKILNAKEIKRFNGFTDTDDEYLAKVRDMLDEGGMPKTVSKRIFSEIIDETNPMKILAAIKRNLPEQFFNHTASAKDVSMSIPKEVILSEYLIK